MQTIATKIRSLAKHSFIRNSVVMFLGSGLVSVINYVFSIILARSTSLVLYGEYTAAIAYVTLLTVPFGAFGASVIRKVGRQDSKKRVAMVQHIEKWLFSKIQQYYKQILFIGVFLGFMLRYFGNVYTASAIFVVVSFAFTLFQVFYFSALQSLRKFSLFNIIQMVAGLVKVGTVYIVMQVHATLTNLYILLTAISVVQILFTRKKLHTHSSGKIATSVANLRTLVKKKSVLIPLLVTLGMIGMANIDLILVKKFVDSELVGIYAALSLFAKMILYLVSPIVSLAYVYLTGKEHEKESFKIFSLLLLFIVFAGLVLSALYGGFSNNIILFTFGQQYLQAQNVLYIAGLYGMLYAVMTLFSQLWMAKNMWVGCYSLLAMGVQVIAITLFHDTLLQVLIINCLILAGLNLYYFSVWLGLQKKDQQKALG